MLKILTFFLEVCCTWIAWIHLDSGSFVEDPLKLLPHSSSKLVSQWFTAHVKDWFSHNHKKPETSNKSYSLTLDESPNERHSVWMCVTVGWPLGEMTTWVYNVDEPLHHLSDQNFITVHWIVLFSGYFYLILFLYMMRLSLPGNKLL